MREVGGSSPSSPIDLLKAPPSIETRGALIFSVSQPGDRVMDCAKSGVEAVLAPLRVKSLIAHELLAVSC